jgi:multiple sugar transport system permease protein
MRSAIKWLLYSAVGLVCVVYLFPTIWVILISFKTPVDAFTIPPKWFFTPTLRNHVYIWVEQPFLHYLKNSAIVAISTPLIAVSLSSLAAYAFSRWRTSFSRFSLFFILTFRMVPLTLIIVPLYVIVQKAGMFDNLVTLIIVYAALNIPFSLWLLRGFFVDIPTALDEAAMIDGCSRFGAFFRIILPTARPGLIAASIFSFGLAWNEYFAALMLTGVKSKLLTVAAAEYRGEDIQYWAYSAAAAIGIVVPAVVFMMFVQKYFTRGLTFGAVKG